MAFNELISLPDAIRAGTILTPRYDTDVVVMQSGKEKRNQNRTVARKRFALLKPVVDQRDYQELRNFFCAIGGGRHGGFRFRDRTDYQAVDLIHPYKPKTRELSAAAGTYQLQREITLGGDYRYRDIKKPVAGTLKVYIDGVRKLESDGTYGWQVDTTTGIITFDTPGNVTVLTITVNFLFDTPVRFDSDDLQVTQVDPGHYRVKMNLIELIL